MFCLEIQCLKSRNDNVTWNYVISMLENTKEHRKAGASLTVRPERLEPPQYFRFTNRGRFLKSPKYAIKDWPKKSTPLEPHQSFRACDATDMDGFFVFVIALTHLHTCIFINLLYLSVAARYKECCAAFKSMYMFVYVLLAG